MKTKKKIEIVNYSDSNREYGSVFPEIRTLYKIVRDGKTIEDGFHTKKGAQRYLKDCGTLKGLAKQQAEIINRLSKQRKALDKDYKRQVKSINEELKTELKFVKLNFKRFQ